MDADLASLEQKLEQLLSRHAAQQARLNSQYASAQRKTARLQERVDALESANRELTDKLGLVGSRLEALLARIPEA
jgi:chromosome segregation ATPase